MGMGSDANKKDSAVMEARAHLQGSPTATM